jgi:hypothetical protein
MNKRFFFSLSVIAVAFALVLGFGALNAAKAVPGESGSNYNFPAGQANLFGVDEAHNVLGGLNRDSDFRANSFAPAPYGLRGTSQQ